MPRNLYLASQSPRRLELLRQIGLSPTVLPLRCAPERADVDETPLPGERPALYVERIARLKVEAGLKAQAVRHLPAWPVLAADTTVTLDGDILGKPADAAEAAAMLRRYSGRAHTVLTGVAVAHAGNTAFLLHSSQVHFRSLSAADIAAYVATGEPFDKAGGYAIQGCAAIFIEMLRGSHSGVMGLPLFETAQLLDSLGFPVLK